MELTSEFQDSLDAAIAKCELMVPSIEAMVQARMKRRYYELAGVDPGLDEGGAEHYATVAMSQRVVASRASREYAVLVAEGSRVDKEGD